MKDPYEDCPRFDSCSVPKCPLDPFYHQRHRETGDKSCNIEKQVRLRIAAKYPDIKLPYGGLTPSEFSGYKTCGSQDSVAKLA